VIRVCLMTIAPARPLGPGSVGPGGRPDGPTRMRRFCQTGAPRMGLAGLDVIEATAPRRGQGGAPMEGGGASPSHIRDGRNRHGAGPAKWCAKGHPPVRIFRAPNVPASVPLTTMAGGHPGPGRPGLVSQGMRMMHVSRSGTNRSFRPTLKNGVPGVPVFHVQVLYFFTIG